MTERRVASNFHNYFELLENHAKSLIQQNILKVFLNIDTLIPNPPYPNIKNNKSKKKIYH